MRGDTCTPDRKVRRTLSANPMHYVATYTGAKYIRATNPKTGYEKPRGAQHNADGRPTGFIAKLPGVRRTTRSAKLGTEGMGMILLPRRDKVANLQTKGMGRSRTSNAERGGTRSSTCQVRRRRSTRKHQDAPNTEGATLAS